MHPMWFTIIALFRVLSLSVHISKALSFFSHSTRIYLWVFRLEVYLSLSKDVFPFECYCSFVKNRRLFRAGQSKIKSALQGKGIFVIPFIDGHNPSLTSIFCLTRHQGCLSKVIVDFFLSFHVHDLRDVIRAPLNIFEAEKQIKNFMIEAIFFPFYFPLSVDAHEFCRHFVAISRVAWRVQAILKGKIFVLLIHVRNSDEKICFFFFVKSCGDGTFILTWLKFDQGLIPFQWRNFKNLLFFVFF